MANESYITKLQRERSELIAAVKAVNGWHAAMLYAETTGRKGDAYREASLRREEMNEALRKIEPLLAEKETTNAG